MIAYAGIAQTDTPRDDGEPIGESASGETVDADGEGGGRGDDRGACGGDFAQGFAFPPVALGRHHLGAVGDRDDRDAAGGSGEGQAESETEVLGVDGIGPGLLDVRPDLTRQFIDVGVEVRALGSFGRGEGGHLIKRGTPCLIDRFSA
ncbi:hypothetical protein [Streptomyces sp. MUM 178J]|uniref:hypothetical protein n=1 Tax=Streptomyces sp. MUM 178J TaxID=2791991 RepID=UPI001F044555|nr:hypothetical protein [Streptomyces sp. MUM 178J]WRQ82779.1 hypothetical protein I3F59_027440 [Streptomyces sp. MUM 178J]